MPWSEEYPESHVRQLNAPRGRFGFLSGGHFPYLTYATLPLQATPAEQDALRFPLLWTHRNMIRDGKRKTFFSSSRKAKPQDKFRKGSLMLEGASPLSDRSASSRKSEEVITDEPHAGKLARVVLAGLS
ncbi:hypothetical protein V6N13_088619 [Hibiscus sabdariffa]|uniref:Uncharacterized protein n=1 Tax=Hibiscus sabdariffa TaxID=183260 RepID=A0ABR2G0S8_9ROSI